MTGPQFSRSVAFAHLLRATAKRLPCYNERRRENVIRESSRGSAPVIAERRIFFFRRETYVFRPGMKNSTIVPSERDGKEHALLCVQCAFIHVFALTIFS